MIRSDFSSLIPQDGRSRALLLSSSAIVQHSSSTRSSSKLCKARRFALKIRDALTDTPPSLHPIMHLLKITLIPGLLASFAIAGALV